MCIRDRAGLDICFATLRTIALITGAWWFARTSGRGIEGAVWGFVLVAGIVTVLAVAVAGIGKMGSTLLTVRQYVVFILPLLLGQILSLIHISEPTRPY